MDQKIQLNGGTTREAIDIEHVLEPFHIENDTTGFFHVSLVSTLFQVLTEYVLVSMTSAVTVTIAGVIKEAVTIVVAVFYFHNVCTWLKGVGLMIIMFGFSLFNWSKYEKLQMGHKTEDEKQLLAPKQDGKYVILDEMDGQEDGP